MQSSRRGHGRMFWGWSNSIETWNTRISAVTHVQIISLCAGEKS